MLLHRWILMFRSDNCKNCDSRINREGIQAAMVNYCCAPNNATVEVELLMLMQ